MDLVVPTAAEQEVAAQAVVVRIGGCRYALAMPAVAEVGRPPSLTRVPGLPAWVAGVANWRGRVLAVLDLRPLLGAGTGPGDRRGRLVVVTWGEVTAGLLTESVDGTIAMPADRIEPSPAHLSTSAGALLSGARLDPRGPIGVLDLEAVFALAGTVRRSRRLG